MKLAPSELVWDACLSTWLHTPDRPMVPNQPINQNMVSSSLSNVQFDVLIANDYFTPPLGFMLDMFMCSACSTVVSCFTHECTLTGALAHTFYPPSICFSLCFCTMSHPCGRC